MKPVLFCCLSAHLLVPNFIWFLQIFLWGPLSLKVNCRGGESPASAEQPSTTTTLVVVAALISGTQGLNFDSLNSLGGGLSIATKFVPPIPLVGPLDSDKVCPSFWVHIGFKVLSCGLFAYFVNSKFLFQPIHVLTTYLDQFYPWWVPPKLIWALFPSWSTEVNCWPNKHFKCLFFISIKIVFVKVSCF